MPRKSKKEIEFEERKVTLYEAAAPTRDKPFAEDRLFCVLIVAGYTGAAAYKIAYSDRATVSSAAALASRKLREPEIQRILNDISRPYWDGLLCLNDKHFTEKRRSWLPKKKKNITPY